jgi:large subunit ribosomal protein L27
MNFSSKLVSTLSLNTKNNANSIVKNSLYVNSIDIFLNNKYSLQNIRHATKKAGGSSKNGRDSPGQHLGVKKFGGEVVIPGNIIIRQRGQKYHSGVNTKMGRDHTIYSSTSGYVHFVYNKIKKHQIVTGNNIFLELLIIILFIDYLYY